MASHFARRRGVLGTLLGLIFVMAGCFSSGVRGPGEGADVHEAAGFDQVVKGLMSVFDHADVLALGENHWRKVDSELRIRLIREPDFAREVHFIVVEFGNRDSQAVLDRYVRGEDVPTEEVEKIWRNTKGGVSGVWESPVYAEFFAAVREVNRGLPAEGRVRVLAGDPPLGSDMDRDDSAFSILKEQVLDKGGKALLIYGTGHLYRAGKGVGGITKKLQSAYPGRIFVVNSLGGSLPEYEKFEGALKTSVRPVLVFLGRGPFGDFSADEFLGGEQKMRVNGVWVNAPVFQDLTLGEVADGCVYFGMSSEVDVRVGPSVER